MKILRDAQQKPDTDWRKWNENFDYYDDIAYGHDVESHFSFVHYHQFWEHPKASALAKASKATIEDVDYDSDLLLMGMLKNLWMDDIISRDRDSTISDNLLDLTEQALFHYRTIESARQKLDKDYEEYHEQIEAEEVEANKKNKSDLDTFLHIQSQTANNIIAEFREIDDTHSDSLNSLLPQILIEMVKTNYSPLPNNAYHYGVKLSYKEDYKELGDKHFYETALLEHLYWLNIATFPGENLPQYVHDVCLYMNYVQPIVVYEHKKSDVEKEIVEKESLLMNETTEVLMVFEEVIEGIHGWWV